MAKAEISWRSQTVDGGKREVYAHHVGDRWKFYVREKRFDKWQLMPAPPLHDWLELLDAVRRRAGRRLLRPEEVDRVENTIRKFFPDVKF